MKMSFSVSGAWALAKRLLAKLFETIGSEKILSALGDILAIAFPHLEKEHWVQLGEAIRNLDPNFTGPDDEIADMFFELGGRGDLVVRGNGTVDIETPISNPTPPAAPTE